MKQKWFTVVAVCLCGCDQTDIHHKRAVDAAEAARKVKDAVANPGEDVPQGGRQLDVLAVFRGRLTDLFTGDSNAVHISTQDYETKQSA